MASFPPPQKPANGSRSKGCSVSNWKWRSGEHERHRTNQRLIWGNSVHSAAILQHLRTAISDIQDQALSTLMGKSWNIYIIYKSHDQKDFTSYLHLFQHVKKLSRLLKKKQRSIFRLTYNMPSISLHITGQQQVCSCWFHSTSMDLTKLIWQRVMNMRTLFLFSFNLKFNLI